MTRKTKSSIANGVGRCLGGPSLVPVPETCDGQVLRGLAEDRIVFY